MAMYISTVAPDPAYLTSSFACDQIPTEENNFVGSEQHGLVQRGSYGAARRGRRDVDEDAAPTLVKEAIALMAEDHVMLPLLQFPKSAAYRTDKVGGRRRGRTRQLPGVQQLVRVGGRRR